MELTQLFESLDEKVFTPELKENLEVQFNEAVELKAASIADEAIVTKTDELNEKSEQHIEMLNEKAEEYKAQLDEKAEKHIETLTEKAEEYVELQKQKMVESVDKYLERIVEELAQDAQGALDESIKSEKADMIIEAFDSMLTATGVEVSKIVEAKDNSSVETELEESITKYDSLVEEVIALKEENEKLIKMGVISEMAEGMSIVEAEKFKKLAGLVDFSRDEEFTNKLETIKESVKGAVEVSKKTNEVEETEDTISEKVEAPKASPYAHLI